MIYRNTTQSNKLAQTSVISKFLSTTGDEDRNPKDSLDPEYSVHFFTAP